MKFRRNLDDYLDKIQTTFRQNLDNLDRIQTDFRQNLDRICLNLPKYTKYV